MVNEGITRKNWQNFATHPGDIVIWNRPDNGVIHTGVADGHAGLYYAGARDPSKHGFGHTKIEYFTGPIEQPTNYGAPTSVYRYERLKS